MTGGQHSGLLISWPRQCQLALVMRNNQRNLQIPIASVHMSVSWGGGSGTIGPWHPASMTTLQVPAPDGRKPELTVHSTE